jgi:RimJ/RimL family protein N-acetyltransferase
MFRAEDFEPYARMMADPEVTRFLGGGAPLDRTEAWRSLAAHLGHWTLRGYGMWALEEKASGLFVGRAGPFDPEGWPGFEIGWALAREHWGKGYATEAARRALGAAFADLGRTHVVSLIVPENRASIRVAERLGEEPEGEAELSGRKVLVYGLSRERWERLAADGTRGPTPSGTRRNG